MEGSVSHSIPASEKVSVTLGALAGFNAGQGINDDPNSDEGANFFDSGFTHLDLSAGVPITAGVVSITPALHVVINGDDFTKITSPTNTDKSVKAWGGVTISWSKSYGAAAEEEPATCRIVSQRSRASSFAARRMSRKNSRRALSRSSSGVRSTDDGCTVAITRPAHSDSITFPGSRALETSARATPERRCCRAPRSTVAARLESPPPARAGRRGLPPHSASCGAADGSSLSAKT